MLWATLKGPQHPDVARVLAALGETLAEQGHDCASHPRCTEERSPSRRRRLALIIHSSPKPCRSSPQVWRALATLKQALVLSQKALAIWEQANSVEGVDQTTSLMQHGEILMRMGDLDGSRRAYERALDMRRTSLGAAHPNVAAADVALSAVEAALGDTDDAATRALKRRTRGPRTPQAVAGCRARA